MIHYFIKSGVNWMIHPLFYNFFFFDSKMASISQYIAQLKDIQSKLLYFFRADENVEESILNKFFRLTKKL